MSIKRSRIDKAAHPIERRMERAFIRSAERTKERVEINTLALALARRDSRVAMRLFPKSLFEEPLSPVGTIARDAVIKGGRIGAEIVNEET